ncbi:hypothetical protein CKM354_000220900 [Cercospora kikuchii]|uniref:Zn(2)-C6 fungal-type domain-containing protein n=1 Tax=Cercospora kikuchii TaxID=84275 RepID=A0A9P3F9E7_9PEZI|nr:uncharacterized protein CKM354_000220900 [Cercospora kikuchii]GIZ38808.1 hypothetical protein CKM354_000220900 [Cercospora kikuchii]
MAPRVPHRKTRTGCSRCKARKVKCDEERPRCGACIRHAVPCEYPIDPYRIHAPGSETATQANAAEHAIELRLMYEWTAFTCTSFSTVWEFWKHQCPMIAFEYPWVQDAMMALTALHASRAKPRYWSSLEGRLIHADAAVNTANSHPEQPASIEWNKAKQTMNGLSSRGSITVITPHDHAEMLERSRRYFTRALEGHQKAVAVLSVSNIRAAYLGAVLISYYALFTLNEPAEESLMLDPLKWFQLSRGVLFLIKQWEDWVGPSWLSEAGAMYGEPDLSDDVELFRKDHQQGFEYLLFPVDGHEIKHEDKIAYERTLSYIGLMYKGVINGTDSPLATGRRVMAMPARVPIRFGELVEASEPRAAAMLAHVFATMKLSEERFPWFEGIGQRQIPLLCGSLPPAWRPLVAWPLQVVNVETPTSSFPTPAPSSEANSR